MRRIYAFVCALLPLAVTAASLVLAHEGHDHGPEPPAAADPPPRETAADRAAQAPPTPRRPIGGDYVEPHLTASDWPTFQRTSARTGYASGTRLLPPRVLWDGHEQAEIAASPVAGGGRLFTLTLAGSLAARDVLTGEVLWRRELGANASATPALDGPTLVLADWDGNVHAVEARTGETRWARAVGALVHASPAVANGRVFVADAEGRIHSLSIGDGQTAWTRDLGAPIVASPSASGSRVYAATAEGRVVSLAAHDGAPLAENRVHGGLVGAPVVWDETVVVADGLGFVVGLDASTLKRRWLATQGPADLATPAVGDGRVVAPSMAVGGLATYDVRNGRLLWKVADPGFGRYPAPVSLGDGVVYAGVRDGRLLAISALNGTLLWEISASRLAGAPALLPDLLLAVGANGQVFAVGAPRVDRASLPGVLGPPPIAEIPLWPLLVGLGLVAMALWRRGYAKARRPMRIPPALHSWTPPPLLARRVVCPWCSCRHGLPPQAREGARLRCAACGKTSIFRTSATRHLPLPVARRGFRQA
ncbi:MAG TPA: PQQ-binding-like beta-propeller repeat protein [Candidatus Thermoplasmatota archaeon]|nr:PQQ-binding-like beta-propeller repeat protein [Candidatus Thermoplasmatota archaeon]